MTPGRANQGRCSATHIDGGWGWMVVLAFSLMLIVTSGPIRSFGLIFGEFLHDLGEGTQSVTTIVGVYMSTGSMTGLFTIRLLNRYSCRQVGIAGGIFFFCGNLLSTFATSAFYLLITYGVLQGFGFGLMIASVHTCFNLYFKRRRTSALGVSFSLTSVGIMLCASLIHFLLQNFGFRGTEFILAAINLHATLAMIMLIPPTGLTGRLIPKIDVDVGVMSSPEPGDTEEVLHAKPESNSAGLENRTVIRRLTRTESRNISTAIIDRVSRLPSFVAHLFDLSLLTDLKYVNLIVGLSLTHFVDFTLFTIEPLFLLSLNFSKAQVSSIIVVCSFGDLSGRLLLAIFGGFFYDRNKLLFWLGACGTLINLILLMYVSNFMVIAVASAVLGACRGFILVCVGLVLAEYVAVDRFPAAFGIFHALFGVVSMACGPLVGLVRDRTGSYALSFTVLAAAVSVCIVLWAAEEVASWYFQPGRRLTQIQEVLYLSDTQMALVTSQVPEPLAESHPDPKVVCVPPMPRV